MLLSSTRSFSRKTLVSNSLNLAPTASPRSPLGTTLVTSPPTSQEAQAISTVTQSRRLRRFGEGVCRIRCDPPAGSYATNTDGEPTLGTRGSVWWWPCTSPPNSSTVQPLGPDVHALSACPRRATQSWPSEHQHCSGHE